MVREAATGRLTTLTAPAKLTVSLRVTGRRSDGYHLLDAEMVSIDLADELTFSEAAERSAGGTGGTGGIGEAEGTGKLAVVGPGDRDDRRFRVPSGEDNLVRKALRAVGRRADVRLVKRIPPGGGLGGGSSDAAAVLRWAGCDDIDVATSLGADVPFCLRGGRARVTGIGEVLSPLPFEARTYTLLIPPFGCSTPAVYRAWDELQRAEAATSPGESATEGSNRARNDLQAAALVAEPRLADWRDRLAEVTGQVPVLAGSGSTWFVEGAYPGEGRIVVHTLPAYG